VLDREPLTERLRRDPPRALGHRSNWREDATGEEPSACDGPAIAQGTPSAKTTTSVCSVRRTALVCRDRDVMVRVWRRQHPIGLARG
jgi:hypothetical protein